MIRILRPDINRFPVVFIDLARASRNSWYPKEADLTEAKEAKEEMAQTAQAGACK